MAQVDFGGVVEKVITRKEFSVKKAKQILAKETIAVLGYGVQGPAQSLNLRDNGLQVIVGQRKSSPNWNKALQDGWIPGESLFNLQEAAQKATFIIYLLSDAGQKDFWPELLPFLSKGKTLIFCHGFSIVYQKITGVIPPKEIDVILVSPKGSGLTVRNNFLDGSGINISYAVDQDFSGEAKNKSIALGICLGASYLFETTFEKEVFCNLTAERGVLLGGITGMMEAQYEELRKHGHSPSEAFNETVETLTQSLLPIMSRHGIDWLFANCSTTAQRGALDWKERFRNSLAPIFKDLYESVSSGTEAQIVIEKNSQPDYRLQLDHELKKMADSEMWKAGTSMRKLRLERE